MERAQEVISVVLHGDCSALQNILDRGEALGGMADEEGSTPLMYAAANDRDAMIRLLLQVGAIGYNGEPLTSSPPPLSLPHLLLPSLPPSRPPSLRMV